MAEILLWLSGHVDAEHRLVSTLPSLTGISPLSVHLSDVETKLYYLDRNIVALFKQ